MTHPARCSHSCLVAAACRSNTGSETRLALHDRYTKQEIADACFDIPAPIKSNRDYLAASFPVWQTCLSPGEPDNPEMNQPIHSQWDPVVWLWLPPACKSQSLLRLTDLFFLCCNSTTGPVFFVLWAIVFKWYMSDWVSARSKKKNDSLWFLYRKLS